MHRSRTAHTARLLVTSSFLGMAYATSLMAQVAPPPSTQAAIQPQRTDPTPPELPEDAEATALGEVVVTDFRQAYADEFRSKRDAIEIIDGISSDDLGRIPDLNIGEALQRVSGVQLNREAERREATINLRGLPGEDAPHTWRSDGAANAFAMAALMSPTYAPVARQLGRTARRSAPSWINLLAFSRQLRGASRRGCRGDFGPRS